MMCDSRSASRSASPPGAKVNQAVRGLKSDWPIRGPGSGRCKSGSQLEVAIDHRQREQRAIHAVKKAAVAWQKPAAVFHTGAALQRRFRQIAELAGDIGG